MKPIAVFQLELEHAPLLNVFMRMHWSKRKRLMENIGLRILAQIGRPAEPLRGRPKLWAVRFSAKKPDQDSAWTKLWLDALVRLGWLRDDSEADVEIVTEWSKAPAGQGRVVVHLFTDEQATQQFEERQGWR